MIPLKETDHMAMYKARSSNLFFKSLDSMMFRSVRLKCEYRIYFFNKQLLLKDVNYNKCA